MAATTPKVCGTAENAAEQCDGSSQLKLVTAPTKSDTKTWSDLARAEQNKTKWRRGHRSKETREQ